MAEINTSKKHILEVCARNVAYYDRHKSIHSNKLDAVVEPYREGKLVIRDWDTIFSNKPQPAVFILYVGQQLSSLDFGVSEIPYCLLSAVTELYD